MERGSCKNPEVYIVDLKVTLFSYKEWCFGRLKFSEDKKERVCVAGRLQWLLMDLSPSWEKALTKESGYLPSWEGGHIVTTIVKKK